MDNPYSGEESGLLMKTDDLPFDEEKLTPGPTQGDPEELHKKVVKTGTTTVGLSTPDGAVLAADQRASAEDYIVSKGVTKIEQIHPTAATTFSGSVSSAQDLVDNIQAEVRLYETRRGKDMSMQALSTIVANLLRTGNFLVSVPLVGGVDEDGGRIFSYDPVGGLMEEPYTVSGSGTPYAVGVLEREYEDEMSLSEARDAAIGAILSAAERDPASGNGMDIATITGDGVEMEHFETLEDVPDPL